MVRFSTVAFGAVPALLGALVACSYVYDVRFDVTLSEAAAAGAGQIVLEVDGDGGPDRVVLAHTPGTTSYQGTVSVCCAPEPTVTVRAFLDTDADGVLDDGEPRAEDPRGPRVLDESIDVALTIGG